MALVERVAPRGRDERAGRPAHPRGHVGEELHECGLGEVRVVEHEHERSPPGESLDHAQEGPRRVLAGTALAQPTAAATWRTADGGTPSQAATSSIGRSPVTCSTIGRSGQ